MPGRGSYGPAGKWIHDRAHRIMSESPETPKGMAYAIATQQGHKVGKSPKGFRTPEGVATAKAKFSLPKKEYRKTAGAEEAMAKRLKTLCSLRDKGYTSDRENKEIKFLRNQLYGDGSMKTAALAGFFDELEKVSSALGAAAKFGVGVLLGSLLWNSLGDEERQDLKERAQESGVGPMWKGAMADPQRDPTAQARKVLTRTKKVAQFGVKKPPDPNIRAVATKI